MRPFEAETKQGVKAAFGACLGLDPCFIIAVFFIGGEWRTRGTGGALNGQNLYNCCVATPPLLAV